MKKHTTLALLSIIFFSNLVSSADWRFLGETTKVSKHVDRESIKIIDDHVFYWEATNLLINDYEYDWKSALEYKKADCDINRFQILSQSFYTEPFGKGENLQTSNPDPKWVYPPPETLILLGLEIMCGVAEAMDNDS